MKSFATYALFGGSFDPPHAGHQKIVDAVLKLDWIDAVIISPAFKNPFKEQYNASPSLRLEWCKTLFKGSDKIVNNFEIEQNRAVYTIEAFNHLSKLYNIQAIVIGADNLKSIQKWRDFEALNSKVKWIVISRPNEPLETSALREFSVVPIEINISSSEIRNGKKLDFVDSAIKKQVLKEYNLLKNSESQ
ncbi:MAG TPA: nicotinate (nicotinamide) nucleotide adenylyltransferase [Nitratifractor sp.]|nr:nicotinate (nicotinamide) nucleotide adenylyltransferase [Nitratifractor sp.]